jgi:hypothetical protein
MIELGFSVIVTQYTNHTDMATKKYEIIVDRKAAACFNP